MRLLVEIVFYVFGILYPITILLSSIKSKKRRLNDERVNEKVVGIFTGGCDSDRK